MLEDKTANQVIKRYPRILIANKNQISAGGTNMVDRYHRVATANESQLEEKEETPEK